MDNTCGDCVLRIGEECDGPSGSREGREVYDDDPACDCFEGEEDKVYE